jgi:cytochrome P450
LEPHIQRLLRKLEKLSEIQSSGQNGQPFVVELQDPFLRLAVDFSTETLFGKSTDSLLENDHNPADSDKANHMSLGQAIHTSLRTLADRGRLLNFYWLIDGPQFRISCKTVHSFVDRYLQEAQDATTNQGRSEKGPVSNPGFLPKETSILSSLVREKKENPRVIRDQLLSLLLASRDTTANFLSWTFYVLARHPEVLAKLRNSIAVQLPHNRLPTAADINALTYLRWTLDEVLRLYPLVPLNGRTAAADTVLPSGGGTDGTAPILVPAGTKVAFSIFAMQRRVDVFGADANVFSPERWGEGRSPDSGRKEFGWAYIPFLAGPRICLGSAFPYLPLIITPLTSNRPPSPTIKLNINLVFVFLPTESFALNEISYITVRLLQCLDSLTAAENPNPRSDKDAWPSPETEYGLADGAVTYNVNLTMGPRDGVWARMRLKCRTE